MKNKILPLTLVAFGILGGVTSCNSSQTTLSDAESRNLRLASGMDLLASESSGQEEVSKVQKASSVGSSVDFSMGLPSLDVVVENNFTIDSTIEGEEGNKTIDYNGTSYTFKETISYLDNNETESQIVLYYDYNNELSDDKEYSENIVGIVTVKNVTLFNFESTAYTEKGYDKRELSLYAGENKTISLEIDEETIVDGDDSRHQFSYGLEIGDTEIISYSISLDKENTSLIFQLSSLTATITRTSVENSIEYNVSIIESYSELESSLTYVRTIKDGEVTYSIKVN